MKKCKTCLIKKPLSEFTKRRDGISSYVTSCKPCASELRANQRKFRETYEYPYVNGKNGKYGCLYDPQYIADKNKLFDGWNGWWWGESVFCVGNARKTRNRGGYNG